MYLWTPPVLNSETFYVQKVSWQTNVNDSFWETFEGKLPKIWSIRIEKLQVTPVEHWISCFKPCIVQNWWYFLASADANFVQTVLFSWTIYLLFSYIFLLKSSKMYVSFASVSIEANFCLEFRESYFGKAICK